MAHTEDTAMFCDAFPCNPRPFRTALAKHLEAGGTITGDHAKRILWTLIGIVRGQMVRIDLAGNEALHNDHLARLPGRLIPSQVLVAMEREAEGLDTPDTIRNWWSSIASLILFAYGNEGIYDHCDEWERLRAAYDAELMKAEAA